MFLGMGIRNVVSKLPGVNNGFGVARDFDNLKFTILTYFCFGTFFMVLISKIGDLQDQIRSVELEARFKSSEIGQPLLANFWDISETVLLENLSIKKS